MDNAIGCQAGQFLTCHTFHCLRTPIGTHVGKDLCTIGQQMAEKHGYTVASIVLCSQHKGFADAIPVEGSVEQSFWIVAVGIEVGPLTLALETCGDGIMTQCLFLEAHFPEFRIACHQVAHNDHHLHNELPVGIFLLTRLAFLKTVLEVFPFVHFTIFLSPSHRLDIFFFVVDAFRHAANNFGQIDRLVTHAQILLEEIWIDDRSCDTHRHATHREVGFATHRSYSLGSTCKAEYLLSHICRNRIVIQVLYITAINAECRKSFLSMTGQHGSQINGTRTLCSIKSPHGFRVVRIHIHRLSAIAPARCDGNGRAYAFAFELLGTSSTFSHTTDGSVGYHALYRATVAILQVIAD